ncbi:chromosome partitioning protein ParB [Plesiomonas shigelloides]|uniref:plasmid partition protein ParG n=1 Tax=Plesiomonas shigelloides TaxID=703 RepID=UPI00126202B2|nr:plasmid partition protein ParG [Plesiomonas shigelloides]KAB7683134.1 chromosome partitioning protein ParB [Plesiomonas shigelloides]
MKMKLGNHKQLNAALSAVAKAKSPTKKLQMNISEDLHKRFKLACLKNEREMTDVTIELINGWLKENEG